MLIISNSKKVANLSVLILIWALVTMIAAFILPLFVLPPTAMTICFPDVIIDDQPVCRSESVFWKFFLNSKNDDKDVQDVLDLPSDFDGITQKLIARHAAGSEEPFHIVVRNLLANVNENLCFTSINGKDLDDDVEILGQRYNRVKVLFKGSCEQSCSFCKNPQISLMKRCIDRLNRFCSLGIDFRELTGLKLRTLSEDPVDELERNLQLSGSQIIDSCPNLFYQGGVLRELWSSLRLPIESHLGSLLAGLGVFPQTDPDPRNYALRLLRFLSLLPSRTNVVNSRHDTDFDGVEEFKNRLGEMNVGSICDMWISAIQYIESEGTSDVMIQHLIQQTQIPHPNMNKIDEQEYSSWIGRLDNRVTRSLYETYGDSIQNEPYMDSRHIEEANQTDTMNRASGVDISLESNTLDSLNGVDSDVSRSPYFDYDLYLTDDLIDGSSDIVDVGQVSRRKTKPNTDFLSKIW